MKPKTIRRVIVPAVPAPVYYPGGGRVLPRHGATIEFVVRTGLPKHPFWYRYMAMKMIKLAPAGTSSAEEA